MSATTGIPGSATNFPTDDGGYGSGVSSGDYQRYIYVLIAVFLGILVVSYWLLVRRRKRALAVLRANGQWVGQHDGMGVWAPIYRRQRREEGLDERGEAPPPYMPGQSPSQPPFNGHGQAMPMQDFSGKPPDYIEHRSSEDEHDLMRPSPTHLPLDRNSAARRLDGVSDTTEAGTHSSLAGVEIVLLGSTTSATATDHPEGLVAHSNK